MQDTADRKHAIVLDGAHENSPAPSSRRAPPEAKQRKIVRFRRARREYDLIGTRADQRCHASRRIFDGLRRVIEGLDHRRSGIQGRRDRPVDGGET
jgi:hypothetical protein